MSEQESPPAGAPENAVEYEHPEDFLRAAHPLGRLSRVGLWVALALLLAFKDIVGPGVAVLGCVVLMAVFVAYRDRTPEATPKDGLFWRIAAGEQLWRSGGAPPETAKSVDLFGKAAIGLALGGVAASAWLGPAGLGLTFAYLVVTAARQRLLAGLGAAA